MRRNFIDIFKGGILGRELNRFIDGRRGISMNAYEIIACGDAKVLERYFFDYRWLFVHVDMAARLGHTDIVRVFLENGYTVTAKGVHDTVVNDHLDVLKLLYEYGIKCDQSVLTEIYMNRDMVNFILDTVVGSPDKLTVALQYAYLGGRKYLDLILESNELDKTVWNAITYGSLDELQYINQYVMLGLTVGMVEHAIANNRENVADYILRNILHRISDDKCMDIVCLLADNNMFSTIEYIFQAKPKFVLHYTSRLVEHFLDDGITEHTSNNCTYRKIIDRLDDSVLKLGYAIRCGYADIVEDLLVKKYIPFGIDQEYMLPTVKLILMKYWYVERFEINDVVDIVEYGDGECIAKMEQQIDESDIRYELQHCGNYHYNIVKYMIDKNYEFVGNKQRDTPITFETLKLLLDNRIDYPYSWYYHVNDRQSFNLFVEHRVRMVGVDDYFHDRMGKYGTPATFTIMNNGYTVRRNGMNRIITSMITNVNTDLVDHIKHELQHYLDINIGTLVDILKRHIEYSSTIEDHKLASILKHIAIGYLDVITHMDLNGAKCFDDHIDCIIKMDRYECFKTLIEEITNIDFTTKQFRTMVACGRYDMVKLMLETQTYLWDNHALLSSKIPIGNTILWIKPDIMMMKILDRYNIKYNLLRRKS